MDTSKLSPRQYIELHCKGCGADPAARELAQSALWAAGYFDINDTPAFPSDFRCVSPDGLQELWVWLTPLLGGSQSSYFGDGPPSCVYESASWRVPVAAEVHGRIVTLAAITARPLRLPHLGGVTRMMSLRVPEVCS